MTDHARDTGNRRTGFFAMAKRAEVIPSENVDQSDGMVDGKFNFPELRNPSAACGWLSVSSSVAESSHAMAAASPKPRYVFPFPTDSTLQTQQNGRFRFRTKSLG